jgi:class 3 adenylate cyclase/tetratricopeptide (TPR) repeat protein
MAACPACAHENRDGARFCDECGVPLASAPVTPPREERKTVTVLFADLAGFTARSERLDPEDVRAMVRPFHDLLRRESEAHGGTLARIVGDAGMVVFGYPTAHEDDAERAVRSAFAILAGLDKLNAERPSLDLHARIGINTGEAVVTYGSTLEDADDLMGDGVNTAARLQAIATVDGIVVGEPTYRATAHRFRYEALPRTQVKGKAEPLAVFRPLTPIARVEWETEEATPFVGRAGELRALVGIFEQVRASATPSFVTVVAQPGLGKSRLVRELARHVESLPELVTWRTGRCLPYGDGLGLWALGEIVKAHAGILDTDDQVTLRAKLDAVLAESDQSLRTWMSDRLAPLVGLETSTEPPQQEEAFTAWRRFLESIARSGPTVLVIEDLHWADSTLVAFLGHLADNVTDLPLLVVTTARPEAADRHPGWLERSQVIRLDALSDAAIAMLVASSFPDASPDLQATILARAAGSPLYAEQLAAMVRERLVPIAGGSLDEDAIPASIAALLAARIDALPPGAKTVLLDASVVGKTFWSGAVAALADRDRSAIEPHVAELVRRELIRPVHPSSMAGEQEHSFWHALLRDVAYGELTRRDRLTKHRAAAAWITDRAGAALGEDAEIVVAHLERALELSQAVGSTTELPAIRNGLVDALQIAATHASQTDVPRSLAHLQRAVELLDAGDPRLPDALQGLAGALETQERFAEALGPLLEARTRYLAAGREVEAALLWSPLSGVFKMTGEVRRGIPIFEESDRVLRRHGGPPLVRHLASAASRAVALPDFDEALRLADEALALARELGLPPPLRALLTRGNVRLQQGDRHGEDDLREVLRLANHAGDLRTAVIVLNWLANELEEFSIPSALAANEERLELLRAHGFAVTDNIRTYSLYLLLGRWDEALEGYQQFGPVREASSAWGSFYIACERTLIELDRGDSSADPVALAVRARDFGDQDAFLNAFPVAARLANAQGRRALGAALVEELADALAPGDLWWVTPIVQAAAEVGRPDLARRILERGTETSRRTGLPDAIVAEAEGDPASARRWYETAVSTTREIGDVPAQARALAGVGRCLLALGETQVGIARLRESREIWDGLRATPRIAEIDALLATVT